MIQYSGFTGKDLKAAILRIEMEHGGKWHMMHSNIAEVLGISTVLMKAWLQKDIRIKMKYVVTMQREIPDLYRALVAKPQAVATNPRKR